MSDVLIRSIGWALVQFLWQGAIIVVATVVALAAFRQQAAVRYAIAVAGLAAMLVTAVTTGVWYARSSALDASNASARPVTTYPNPSFGSVVAPDYAERSLNTYVSSGSQPNRGSVTPELKLGFSLGPLWRLERVEPWLPTLVFMWLGGVLALSLNLLRAWVHVRRVRRTTSAVADVWRVRIETLATRLRLTRPVRVCESALVEAPAVIGWLRPALLIPASALTGLSPTQLDAVLAHELAHVRRHDYLINILQSGVETLLFFHPAVWWLSHRIRLEREHCCDDVALDVCGDAVLYAEALMSLEEARLEQQSLMLAATDGPLLARIRRLLAVHQRERRAPSVFVAGVGLVLVAGLLTARSVRSAPDVAIAASLPTVIGGVTPLPKVGPVPRQSSTPGSIVPPVAPNPPAAANQDTVIRGRLTAAGTGTPLRGARVMVVPSPADPSKTQYLFTDNDGRYEAKHLSPGRFTVRATKEGFVELAYGETRPLQGGKTLQIGDRETISDVNFALPRGGVITGRVLDTFGDPVARAPVSAREVRYVNGRQTLVPVIMTGGPGETTNDIGEFRIYGLPPGSYYILAFKNVTTEMIYTQTYAPGTASVADARRVIVEPGGVVNDVTVVLGPVIRLATVSGTVISPDNRPIVGSRVSVYRAGAVPPAVGGSSALTASGTFTIPGVRPGTYELRANTANAAAVGTVTVTGEDVNNVVLRPIAMPTMSGRVIADPLADPLPIASLRIGAVTTDESNSPGWIPEPVPIAQDKTFAMYALPGRWLINPTLPAGWMLKAIRARGVDVTDSGIDFREGEEVRDVEIELTNRLPRLTGTVRGVRGETVNEYTVVVFARDAARRIGTTRYFAFARPGDSAGRFSIATLAPGEYYAIALPYVNVNESQDPELLAKLARDASTVTLREGEAKTLDLRIVQ